MNETTNARVPLRHTPPAAPHASGAQRPSIHKRGAGVPVAHRPATTIEVTNCADTGVGSLRDAVSQGADCYTGDLVLSTCSSITMTKGHTAIG